MFIVFELKNKLSLIKSRISETKRIINKCSTTLQLNKKEQDFIAENKKINLDIIHLRKKALATAQKEYKWDKPNFLK